MAINANTATDPLPREMEQHTYSIMYEVEGKHWWFVGRRRIIAEFVQKVCRDLGKQRPRILDVGCGTGANLQMLAQFGAAEGVDVSAEALDFCRARGLNEVKQGAAESLPFADASFDLVTGLDVVEHLDDDIRDAGLEVERASYANVTFFVPILIGRALMRLTGLRPASENNITIGALNGLLGRILGAESWWLRRMKFPFGVSIVCVARKI